MTSTEVRIPLTEIRVKFRASTKRPITDLDRMVMQAIAAGASSVDSLNSIFQIGERLLVECLVDLMDLALLALDTGGSGFRLTEFGVQSLEQGLTSFGERLDDAREKTFLREDLAGRIAPGQIIWYDREKGDIDPVDAASVISHGEIEKLLIQELKKDGKHLHSVESILPVRDGISFKVTVNNGAVSGLPNQWNHLKPLLQVEAEKRTGIGHATSQRDLENEQDDSFEAEVSLDVSDLLLKASDHEEALARAIEQAHSHLLVLSAHASEAVLNKLKEPIKAAILRGVRVDVICGLPSLDEGGESHVKTTKKWLQETRKSLSGGAGNNLTVNDEPLNSDAKVLIWDIPDGSYQAIVGSYNWLYGLDSPSSGRLGSEVGVRLNDPRLVGNICTTLSGWIDAHGQQLNGVALRWRNIGLSLAQKGSLPASGGDAAVSKVRIVYDENHAGLLREGLVHASKRFLVSSHKLNRSATGSSNNGGGKLDWLSRRNPVSDFQFVLVTGRKPKADSWASEDQNRLEELVKCVDGSIRLGEGTHARVLVYDDVAVVSGYNFLSTTHDKRQIGVKFRGPTIANEIWDAFKAIDI
jgi:hypothetical protein